MEKRIGYIAILKVDSLQVKETTFKKNTNYRVSWDDDGKGCLVYGEWITRQKFDANFEMYVPVLQERLRRLGFIENDKPIKFKEFKERCYVVGKGYVNIFYYSHPKDNMFALYPWGTKSKAEGLKVGYQMLIDLINGNSDDIDCGYLRWGNGGLPLGGGYPRREEDWYRKEFLKKPELNLDILK